MTENPYWHEIRRRRSDLDHAWRDVTTLMPDHARTGGPTAGDPVWAIGVAEGVARACARLLRCDDDTAYALAASGYRPRGALSRLAAWWLRQRAAAALRKESR